MEEAGRWEEEVEEEEEESPKELESEEEEIAIAGGLGFSALLALGGRSFAVKKSGCRGRLNSEKVEDGSAVFTFYEEPVAETLRLPWWLQCV